MNQDKPCGCGRVWLRNDDDYNGGWWKDDVCFKCHPNQQKLRVH